MCARVSLLTDCARAGTTDGAILHHVSRAEAEKVMRDAEAAIGHVRTYRTADEVDKVAP